MLCIFAVTFMLSAEGAEGAGKSKSKLWNVLETILNHCNVFASFPQKRNGTVFSSGVNYLHTAGNIQSGKSS